MHGLLCFLKVFKVGDNFGSKLEDNSTLSRLYMRYIFGHLIFLLTLLMCSV